MWGLLWVPGFLVTRKTFKMRNRETRSSEESFQTLLSLNKVQKSSGRLMVLSKNRASDRWAAGPSQWPTGHWLPPHSGGGIRKQRRGLCPSPAPSQQGCWSYGMAPGRSYSLQPEVPGAPLEKAAPSLCA